MPCPCGSGNSYENCCYAYHQGKIPETALSLMRSRYSAYAKGNVDYLINTTHPENPERLKSAILWRKRVESFCEKTQFASLEIVDVENSTEEAFVTFIAEMYQDSKDVTFTEKSRFIKQDGKWLYHSGLLKWGKAEKEDFD